MSAFDKLSKSIQSPYPKQDKKKFYVYKGMIDSKIVYIGTTTQQPADRFRWHKANGKNFTFEVLHAFDTADEMIDKEFELIKLYNPKYNKIKRQNSNVPLTAEVLNARKGNTEWCQCCFKRRVNKGYSVCYLCGKL